MDQREKIVAIAVAEIGYREYQGNNTKYGVWYGLNYQPWCAIFISWCANWAGVLGSNNKSGIIPRTAWVPDYYDYYQRLGRYKPRGTYTPRPGDIILYGNNDHAGIVESCDGVQVVTIEGNTSANGNNSNGDGVYRRVRSLSNTWIKGYCLPEYQEVTEVRYQTVAEIPAWGKATVEKLIKMGVLLGNSNGLDLSEDMLRILVMNDRAGLYDEKPTEEQVLTVDVY